MPFKFFQIPTSDTGGAAEELNTFLRSHRITAVRSELVRLNDTAFWAFSVEYAEAGARSQDRMLGKVDYREVLNETEFKVFSRLRDWRKAQAEREGVPIYTVFTNEQLADMVRRGVQSRADLGKIEGIGEARLNKYGEAVLQVIAPPSQSHETGRPPG
jgi:superfamily II DNA helicase RecQ